MNNEQRELIEQWESQTSWDFMSKDEVRSDSPKAFMELWQRNQDFLLDVASQSDVLINEYQMKHMNADK